MKFHSVKNHRSRPLIGRTMFSHQWKFIVQRFDWLTGTCNTCSQVSVNMESDFTSIFLTHRKEKFKTISLIKQPPKIIKTTFVASLTWNEPHGFIFTIFIIHSLWRIAKLTRSLRSLVRLTILRNSWIKIVRTHQQWSNLYFPHEIFSLIHVITNLTSTHFHLLFPIFRVSEDTSSSSPISQQYQRRSQLDNWGVHVHIFMFTDRKNNRFKG